jgi:hypothetical protein
VLLCQASREPQRAANIVAAVRIVALAFEARSEAASAAITEM